MQLKAAEANAQKKTKRNKTNLKKPCQYVNAPCAVQLTYTQKYNNSQENRIVKNILFNYFLWHFFF